VNVGVWGWDIGWRAGCCPDAVVRSRRVTTTPERTRRLISQPPVPGSGPSIAGRFALPPESRV